MKGHQPDMTTVPTKPDEALLNAEQQLSALDEKQATLKEKFAQLSTAIEYLKNKQQDRAANIASLQKQVDDGQSEFNNASAFAKVCLQTPREAQATKAVTSARKALKTAQDALDKAQADLAANAEQDQQNIEALQQQAVSLGDELQSIDKERAALTAAKRRIHIDQGYELCETLKSAFYKKKKRVDELKQQLVEAQADMQDAYSSALDALQPWPSYQSDIRVLMDTDDALTRMLKASLQYTEMFLAECHNINKNTVQTLKLPSLKNAFGHRSIFDALIVHQDIISVAFTNATSADQALRARRDLLKALIDEYKYQ
jgi:chromosome segregation ATPase